MTGVQNVKFEHVCPHQIIGGSRETP